MSVSKLTIMDLPFPTFIQTCPKLPPPTVVSEIAILAKVPEKRRTRLNNCINMIIDYLWYDIGYQASFDPKVVNARQLNRVGKAARELHKALTGLDNTGKFFLDVVTWDVRDDDPSMTVNGIERRQAYEKMALEIGQTARKAAELVGQKRPKPGRPSGVAKSNPGLRIVVSHLVYYIDMCDGEAPTLNKNDGHGTMIRILDLLAPYMPPDTYNPEDPPLSTLDRLLREWTRN
jgi:hypothetical protein